MLWLATACALFVLALLAERRQWLVFGTFVTAVVAIAAAGAFNPDRFIAEQNLARYANGRPLDAAQLTDLSADATPAILRALDEASARGDVAAREALGAGLRRQLAHLDATAEAPWPAWNLARADAHAMLGERRTEIEMYPLPGRRPNRVGSGR
jgi:hypothetical protein